MEKPLVSICCITYNHAKFIRKCLEGFLMQKTNFNYEIIIHDDASTDETRQVINEYINKFPDLFVSVFQTENQYSKGVRGMYAKFVYPLAKGKYIALCEGDDYWTDPLKLQKQVNALEGNSSYVLSHSDCDFYYESTKEKKKNANLFSSEIYKSLGKETNFKNLISRKLLIRTASVVFRKDIYNVLPKNNKIFLMGDTPMWLDFSQKGLFHYLNESTVVYRISPNTMSRQNNEIKKIEFSFSMAEMRVFYCKKYDFPIPEYLRKSYNKAYLKLMVYDSSHIPLYDPLINNPRQLNIYILLLKYKYLLRVYYKIRKN